MATRKRPPESDDAEYPPGHDVVAGKEPCPNCGSKDNLVRYMDGHAYCFSVNCGHREPPREEFRAMGTSKVEQPKHETPGGLLKTDERSFHALERRKLDPKTLQKFGYFTAGWKGSRVHVAPYYDQEGTIAAQKLRTPEKEFPVLWASSEHPSMHDLWLFGRHVWGDKHDRKVVVFTGELDAMTAAQVTSFKFPCVSVPAGDGSAKKSLQANFRWLDRFEEIILFFDTDESGEKALKECLTLFAVGKVKVARMEGYKDASDAMQANRPGDIDAAIWSAATWRPRGIVNAADLIRKFADGDVTVPSWSYPWSGLQNKTRGMRRGEVVYHVAGTGIGKTSLMYEIEHHLIRTYGEDGENPCKVGHMGFEDTSRSVQLGLMSVHASRRLHLDPASKEELLRIHKEVFGSRRVELFDPEEAEWGVEAILGYVRYMAKALDCGVLVLDPLSFIAAGIKTDNMVQALDKVSADLAKLAKELAITMHVPHHLSRGEGRAHEEGGQISLKNIRGSGGIANFSSGVFAYERDQQGSDPTLVRTRILKMRFTGYTGAGPLLRYDTRSGRYTQDAEEWHDDDASRPAPPEFGNAAGDY